MGSQSHSVTSRSTSRSRSRRSRKNWGHCMAMCTRNLPTMRLNLMLQISRPGWYRRSKSLHFFSWQLGTRTASPGIFTASPSKPYSALWATVFLSPDPGSSVHKWTYPVVFVSELLVAASYRRRGIARALHDRILAARSEHKAVLLAHPDAARGAIRVPPMGLVPSRSPPPFPDTPLYDTLMKDLPTS